MAITSTVFLLYGHVATTMRCAAPNITGTDRKPNDLALELFSVNSIKRARKIEKRKTNSY